MGMDVYGKNPITKTGEYFRASVWTWRPIASLSLHFAPRACTPCKNWGTNDGDGLDAEGAKLLANILQEAIANGRMLAWLHEFDRYKRDLPDEPCPHCDGTGKRDDEYVKGQCNACKGTGKRRPFDTWYDVDMPKIEAWVAFLKDSGGFRIY